MKKPTIGDIYEIETSVGLAYAQFTHDTDGGRFGEVLRILDGIHGKRPSNFTGIPTKYVILYPLTKLVRKGEGYVEFVANEEVPPEAREFPMFRNGTPGQDGKVADWWLWDGHNERRVGKLAPEQRSYPFFEVLNPEALKETIETGWTPESDPR